MCNFHWLDLKLWVAVARHNFKSSKWKLHIFVLWKLSKFIHVYILIIVITMFLRRNPVTVFILKLISIHNYQGSRDVSAYSYLATTRRLSDAKSMLGQRWRSWPNIDRAMLTSSVNCVDDADQHWNSVGSMSRVSCMAIYFKYWIPNVIK